MIKQEICPEDICIVGEEGKNICIPICTFLYIFADLQYLHPGLYIFADLQYLHPGLYIFALRVNTRLSDTLAFGFPPQKIKNDDDC